MIAKRGPLGIRVEGNGEHFTVDYLAATQLRMPEGVEFRAAPSAAGRLSAVYAKEKAWVFDGAVRVKYEGGQAPYFAYEGDLVGSFCRDIFATMTGVTMPDGVVGRFDLEVSDVRPI